MTLGEYIGAGSATTKLLLHLNGNSTDSSGNGNNGTDTDVLYHKGIRWVDDFSSGNYDNWTVTSGTWNIVSGKLRSTVAGKISRPISSGDNIFVQAKITVGADGNDVRRLMLYDESNNYISAWMRWDTNQVKLIKTGDVVANTNSYILSSGTEYTVILYKYGSTYSLYINGAFIQTAASFYDFTPTKVTLSSESNITTDYDDIIFSTIAEGKFNKGAGFNGLTSKIVKASALTPSNTALTISAFVKKQEVTGDNRRIIVLQGASANYGIIQNTNNTIQFYNYSGSTVFSITSSAVSNDVYHSIIAVIDGTNQYLYIDGSLAGSSSATASNLGSVSYNIGATASPSWFYKGSLDEIIIENRAWSAEEIKKRYTFALGRF